MCERVQPLNTGRSCQNGILFLRVFFKEKEKKSIPFSQNGHDFKPRVRLNCLQLLIAVALHDISHWKQDSHFQLWIIVFLFCIVFISSLSPLIPGRFHSFIYFLFFFFGGWGRHRFQHCTADAEQPAERVKSKAISEGKVHLFGL